MELPIPGRKRIMRYSGGIARCGVAQNTWRCGRVRCEIVPLVPQVWSGLKIARAAGERRRS